MPTIINKHSETAGAVPAVTELLPGEIAVNTADKMWFTKTTNDDIVCLNYLTLLDGGEILAPVGIAFSLQTETGDNLITSTGAYINGTVTSSGRALKLQTETGDSLITASGAYINAEQG